MTIAGIHPVQFGKKVAREFTADDISGLAAELSYRYFLALFPFFIFLAALGGFIANMAGVQNPTQNVMNLFGDALPADARSVLEKQVRGVVNSQNGALLSVGIIGALYAASGGMKALMKALNRVYDVPETRPFWKSTGLALLLTLAATFGIIGSIILFIVTTAWAGDIADTIGAGSAFAMTIDIIRWPLILLLLFVAVGFMYWVAPNVKVPFRFISPGAVLFVIVWIVASIGFAFYVRNFASYNQTYGALGGVVILLLWLYLTNITMLLGAEINSLLDAERDPEGVRQRREAVMNKASSPKEKQVGEAPPERSGGQERQVSRDNGRRPTRSLAGQPAAAHSASHGGGILPAAVFGFVVGLAAAGGRILPRNS